MGVGATSPYAGAPEWEFSHPTIHLEAAAWISTQPL